MLEIRCDKCQMELRQPGALAFSPPKSDTWIVEKYHICSKCWPEIEQLLTHEQPHEMSRDK
jgi:hypothetical protein